MAGEYERRSDVRPSVEEVGKGFSDAGAYYGDQAKQAAARAGEMFGRAKDAFTDAFKTGSR
jgi:hypothetical protein